MSNDDDKDEDFFRAALQLESVAIDVSDLTALAVGQYVMMFASLEAAIDLAISGLLDRDDRNLGAIVTAQPGFSAKLELLGALHKYRCSLKSERDTVDELITDCRQAGEVRNRIVHADWPQAHRDDKPFIKVVRAKAKHGLRIELVDMPPQKLANDAAHLGALTTKTYDLFDLYAAHGVFHGGG